MRWQLWVTTLLLLLAIGTLPRPTLAAPTRGQPRRTAQAPAPASAPVTLPRREVSLVESAPLVSSSAASVRRSARAFLGSQEVVPGDRQLGMELTFATSAAGLAGAPVRFTDLVTWGLAGRTSLGDRIDLSARLDLLAKQPHPAQEGVVQGGELLARVRRGERDSFYVGTGAGAIAGGPGVFGELSAGWTGRAFIDRRERYIAFAGSAGAGWTRALGAAGGRPPWLLELNAGGALQFIFADDPEGLGLSIGTDFAFPIHRGGDAFWVAGAPPFEAGARVAFHVAAFLLLSRQWEVQARWAVIDRGDSAAPESRLPLLVGGYDQSQLVFALSYHFGAEGP